MQGLSLKSSEHFIQSALIQYTTLRGYPWDLIYAIPNGGQRHIATARKLKAEGVKAGVPDLHLPVARKGYHGLYIELKSATGKPTESQIAWMQRLTDEGYKVELCRGFDSAKAVIDSYLESDDF